MAHRTQRVKQPPKRFRHNHKKDTSNKLDTKPQTEPRFKSLLLMSGTSPDTRKRRNIRLLRQVWRGDRESTQKGESEIWTAAEVQVTARAYGFSFLCRHGKLPVVRLGQVSSGAASGEWVSACAGCRERGRRKMQWPLACGKKTGRGLFLPPPPFSAWPASDDDVAPTCASPASAGSSPCWPPRSRPPFLAS